MATRKKPRKTLTSNKREVSIENINPAPYNPREISPEAHQALRHSMEDFGLVEDLVWNENTGNLVSGHQRLGIIREQGYEAVTVTVVNLTDDEEKALNIALNNEKARGVFTVTVDDLVKDIQNGRPDLFDRLRLFEVSAPDLGDVETGDAAGEIAKDRTLREMEIRPFEHWDYLAIVFDSQNDWMFACSKLGIDYRETSPTPNQTRIGIGRVLTGAKLVKLLQCIPANLDLKVILDD